MCSVLEKKYIDPERPYSSEELNDIRKKFIRYLRVGNVVIRHDSCGHSYLAKSNGRKEKEAIDSNGQNLGSCSVCWKINRTPKNLRNNAQELVDIYMETPSCNFAPPVAFSYVDLEKDFYTWLYNEFNPVEPRKNHN